MSQCEHVKFELFYLYTKWSILKQANSILKCRNSIVRYKITSNIWTRITNLRNKPKILVNINITFRIIYHQKSLALIHTNKIHLRIALLIFKLLSKIYQLLINIISNLRLIFLNVTIIMAKYLTNKSFQTSKNIWWMLRTYLIANHNYLHFLQVVRAMS